MPEIILTPEATPDECAAWLSEYLTELAHQQKTDEQAIAALKSVTAATPDTAPHFRVTEALEELYRERNRRQKIMNAIRITLEEYEE